MDTLLHISVSPRGLESHSRHWGHLLASGLCSRFGMEHMERDLAALPPPYPSGAFADASLKPEALRDVLDRAVLELSEHLISELAGAAIVVIDTPMHNFTVPATLKSWIDQVVRPDRTFRSVPGGKIGLLADRPVFAVVASGGRIKGGRGQRDYLTPYLQYVFETMGIRSFQALILDGMRRGEAEIFRKEEIAREWISRSIAQVYCCDIREFAEM